MSDSKQLVTSFKRKGHFDKYRHSLYSSFKEPGNANNKRLVSLINDNIARKIKEDPSLLQQNKGKVSGLMTGYLYKDEAVNKIIEQSIKETLQEYPDLKKSIHEELTKINDDIKESKKT